MAVIDEFGPPDLLRMSRARVPEPGPGEVLISVRSIGGRPPSQQLT